MEYIVKCLANKCTKKENNNNNNMKINKKSFEAIKRNENKWVCLLMFCFDISVNCKKKVFADCYNVRRKDASYSLKYLKMYFWNSYT